MPTVLHVIDGGSPQATPATLALLAATTRYVEGVGHQALLLGGTGLERDAQLVGLNHAERIGVAGERPVLGASAVWRWFRSRRVDLVHAWSVDAWGLCGCVAPRTPRVLSLTQRPDAATMVKIRRKLRRHRHKSPSMVTVLHEAMQRDVMDGGIGASSLTIMPPAIEAGMLDGLQRQAVRSEWALDGPDDRVLALLGDPPTAADARKSNLGVGLAHESLLAALGKRPGMRLLMHPDQRHRLSAYRLLMNYGVARLIVQESRVASPWQILPACDAALIPAEHVGGLATCWAMAAGLAIVTENDSPADGMLRNEHNALIADRDQPKRLAHRLHQLIVDQPLASRIGEQARRDAQQRFAPGTYAAGVTDLYRSLLASQEPRVDAAA